MTTDHPHELRPACHVVEAVNAVSDAMGHLVEALRTGDPARMQACQSDLRRAQGHVDQLGEDR